MQVADTAPYIAGLPHFRARFTIPIILNLYTAASCVVLGDSSSSSRWHAVTIASVPAFPLPLFRLHPIVNWAATYASETTAQGPCNLSSALVFISPSSPCAATLPLTLRLAPSPLSPADVVITPSCPHTPYSNVSISCNVRPQQSLVVTTRCGQPAVFSGAAGRTITCRALQHAWSGGGKAFSSTGDATFLLPSPPSQLAVHCHRPPHASFAWAPPASPPSHYMAALVARGAVIGLQRIEPSLPYETVRVRWLLPATAPWAASCVASVYPPLPLTTTPRLRIKHCSCAGTAATCA